MSPKALNPCCLSLQNIPTFLKSFSGEVDVSEALEPIDSFKCFNEVGTLVIFAAYLCMVSHWFSKIIPISIQLFTAAALQARQVNQLAVLSPSRGAGGVLDLDRRLWTPARVSRVTFCSCQDVPVVQFFYRKLKPEARPIAQPKDMDVVVSAADCRLSAFATVDDATRCWIKVRAALTDHMWLVTQAHDRL
jgi:Phosphatidylserine decarboxylase